ncbi:hypothetical protein J3A83DRAFT_4190559 [Scleroderma citrinum]
MSCHHPSHLILQINEPPTPETCLMRKHVVEAVNAALHLQTDIKIIRVKWNDNGNCIVITNPQFTADDLLLFHHLLGPILTDNSTYKAIPNKEWYWVLLNSVNTGKGNINNEMDGCHLQGQDLISVMMELKANNSCMANVTFLENPCWIACPETLTQNVKTGSPQSRVKQAKWVVYYQVAT